MEPWTSDWRTDLSGNWKRNGPSLLLVLPSLSVNLTANLMNQRTSVEAAGKWGLGPARKYRVLARANEEIGPKKKKAEGA